MNRRSVVIYRNAVIITAILIAVIVFIPQLLQTFNVAAYYAPEPSYSTTEPTAGGEPEADAGPEGMAAPATTAGRAENRGASAAKSADSFFPDKMAKDGNSAVAPNGIFSEGGAMLLAAAGFDAGQGVLLGNADGAGDEEAGLTLAQLYAARVALYPNGPISMLSTAAALNTPYANIQMAAISKTVAGAAISAGQALLDSGVDLQELIPWQDDTPKKPVYLTVDDGPSELTRQYLSVLRERGVRATFFVIGRSVRTYPDIIREMYEDGHCIANHSYSHNYTTLYQSSSSLASELRRCDEAISDVLGFEYKTGIFRFPGGSMYKTASKYKGEVQKLGYTYYDWNCLNGDAQTQPRDKSPDGLYNYMVSSFKGQDEVILLMHDSWSKQSSVNMLGRAIDFFIDNGYEFRTLDEK